MDFVTASTGLISPYWMGLPIRYIQLEERLKVKVVICDAYQTYLTMPEKYFPNSCTVLDSFHAVGNVLYL